jgi:uncharacterized SAM-binding protein YcdF (DUF218 family)
MIVFSGPGSEAEVRTTLALELGVQSQTILREVRGRNTREEADRIRELLGPRDIRKILLVTDSNHMTRGRALFEAAGFRVVTAAAGDVSDETHLPEGRLTLLRHVLRELIGYAYYRLAGYI